MEDCLNTEITLKNPCFLQRVYPGFVIVLLVLMAFSPVVGHAAVQPVKGQLIINSGSTAPLTINGDEGFYPELIKVLFKHLDIKVVVKRMQSANSLKALNLGKNDGVIARVKGIEKIYKNLVRVPEKVIDLDFIAYSNDKNIKIKKWSDLKDYNIAYIKGWKIYDKNVREYKSLTKVKDMYRLATLLKNKKVDVILTYNIIAGYTLDKLNFAPYRHTPPLAKKEMFIYMHKRHASLVPQIASELKAIKENGTYKKIYNKYIK